MLSVSHIAWPPEQEDHCLASLLAIGVAGIEIAPRRVFGDPLRADEATVRAIAARHACGGMRITSFQALLFGVDGAFLFGRGDERRTMAEVLKATGRVAGWCGAGPMVFGSPKNRLKGAMSHAEAMAMAAPFFREVGDACAGAGSCLVMEANPAAYGADFCTTLAQAAELVEKVDSPGFGLHVDAGGLGLSGEDFHGVLRQASGLVRHVHASQPGLGAWDTPHAVHAGLARLLDEIGYAGDIAIEMREQPEGWEAVQTAVRQVRGIYPVT